MENRDYSGFERISDAITTPYELRIVGWLAPRLPACAKPDHLTMVGCLGALLVAVAYVMSANDPRYLWLASFGLVVNWFGDSLDGNLARLRAIERPRYGYYVDNGVDVLQQIAMAAGVAMSGYIRADLCFTALALFFSLSILTLLRAEVFRNFHLSYGKIGPTEVRLIGIALNTIIYIWPPKYFTLFGIELSYPNIVSIVWSASMLITFIVTFAIDLKQLSRDDPGR